jgi:UDP-glucose 4-epimerase
MTPAEQFSGRSVLITGGAGFIGSNLARALVGVGARVMLVDSLIPEYGGNLANIEDIAGDVTLNIADVRDTFSMRYLVQGVEYLFSLAGQTSHGDSMTDPFTDLDINARAQLSILEACRAHNPAVKIVFASTRQVYGRPRYLPVDEAHPLTPVDVNGVNKLAGEWFHLLYHSAYGVRAGCLRLTNTYGPAMRVKDARQTFVGIWIKRLLLGQPLLIFGDGQQQRDFTYVDDAVGALLNAATTDAFYGTVLNLGGIRHVNLNELAELMIKVNGSGTTELVPFTPEARAIDIGDFWADDSRARDVLSWEPRVDLEEGLRRTLTYYRERSAQYFD